MKVTLRLPTQDQYAFIEVETEVLSVEQAVEGYNAAMGLLRSGEGMSDKELDTWIENMLLGDGNDADTYSKATTAQKVELHRIKRALNRIKAKQTD